MRSASVHPRRPRFGLLLVIVLLLPALSGCSDAFGPDPGGPDDPAPDALLFLSTRDGATSLLGPLADIYRVNTDGTGLENLTRAPSRYLHLSLAPDGRRVAFVRADPGCGIWVMETDGSGLAPLTNRTEGAADGCNAFPRWSPDGARIAFVSNRDQRRIGDSSGLNDVFVMNADGSDPRNVSAPLAEEMGLNVMVIGWSPDGEVVFQTDGPSGGGVDMRVYLVRPDGTGLRPMFETAGDHTPAWSPDGSRVAFIRDDGDTQRLHVMNANGTAVIPVGNHDRNRLSLGTGGFSDSAFEHDPWSPDGTRLVFERYDAGGWGTLYVVNADGTGVRNLSLGHGQTMFNGWSPDGRHIAYTRYHVTPQRWQDVYIASVDGVVATGNLTDTPHQDSDAIWIRPR
jgi:Tol biopolymer transport system component